MDDHFGYYSLNKVFSSKQAVRKYLKKDFADEEIRHKIEILDLKVDGQYIYAIKNKIIADKSTEVMKFKCLFKNDDYCNVK